MPVDVIPCPAIIVTDGDSLRCGEERLRLLGIDAPEMGKCSAWRVCVPGNGEASKRSLVSAVNGRKVRYKIVGRDRYGRSLVVAWAGKINLACWQLERRQAEYVAKWDNGHLVAQSCGIGASISS